VAFAVTAAPMTTPGEAATCSAGDRAATVNDEPASLQAPLAASLSRSPPYAATQR